MPEYVDGIIHSLRRGGTSWLKQPVRGFLEQLLPRKLKQVTLRGYAHCIFRFGEFVEQEGSPTFDQLPQWIGPFLERSYPRGPHRGIAQNTLARFVRYLRGEGILPHVAPAPPGPYDQLLTDYTAYLLQHRGVCPEYVRDVRNTCAALLTSLGDTVNLRDLRPEHLHRFVVTGGETWARTTLSSKCTILRGFLAYLHRRGLVPLDLSSAVVSPRIYEEEQCPRFLIAAEVQAVLAVVNRQVPMGRRNYAILLLLAVYGLRGIEVRRLRLDDIDWRQRQLHIRRRKADNNTTYPLDLAVGEAIAAYLRNDRPDSPHREVFLSVLPPFAPLRTTHALGRMARAYMAQAGVCVDHPGTHTFRYSCAQRLLEEEVPLKVIGDFLGHQDPSSTQRYMKIALGQLHEIALGDGEDLL
jgi:integrase/recombinase XerD